MLNYFQSHLRIFLEQLAHANLEPSAASATQSTGKMLSGCLKGVSLFLTQIAIFNSIEWFQFQIELAFDTAVSMATLHAEHIAQFSCKIIYTFSMLAKQTPLFINIYLVVPLRCLSGDQSLFCPNRARNRFKSIFSKCSLLCAHFPHIFHRSFWAILCGQNFSVS